MAKEIAKKVATKVAVKVAAKKAAQPQLPAHVPIVQRYQKPDTKPAVKVAAKAVEKAPKAEQVPNKMDKAREIFKKMKGKPRKEVLAAFVADAGLTVAGSATYFSNIRKEFESK